MARHAAINRRLRSLWPAPGWAPGVRGIVSRPLPERLSGLSGQCTDACRVLAASIAEDYSSGGGTDLVLLERVGKRVRSLGGFRDGDEGGDLRSAKGSGTIGQGPLHLVDASACDFRCSSCAMCATEARFGLWMTKAQEPGTPVDLGLCTGAGDGNRTRVLSLGRSEVTMC